MTTSRCLHWLLGPASGGLAQRPCSRPRRLLTQCHSHTGDHGHSPGLGTTTAMQAHFLPSSSLRKANLEDKTGTRSGLLFSIIEILSCRKWDSRLTCESSGFCTTQNAPSKSTVPNSLHTKLRDSGQTGRLSSHSKYKRAQQHDDGKAWDLGLCASLTYFC